MSDKNEKKMDAVKMSPETPRVTTSMQLCQEEVLPQSSEKIISYKKEQQELDKNEPGKIKYTLLQRFFAELAGTCLLVFGSVGGPIFCDSGIIASSLLSGFTITCVVHIFHKISMAHYNPAVSISCFLKKYLTLKEMLIYILAQVLGAFAGCIFIALCRKGNFDKLGATKIQQYLININDGEEIDAWCYISALICELLSTSIIITFVYSISEKNNNLGNALGLIFGATIIMLVLLAGNLTAASFNPARSLAPAVLQAIAGGDKDPIKQIWIYIIGPIGGGVLSFFCWKIFEIK